MEWRGGLDCLGCSRLSRNSVVELQWGLDLKYCCAKEVRDTRGECSSLTHGDELHTMPATVCPGGHGRAASAMMVVSRPSCRVHAATQAQRLFSGADVA